MAAAATASLFAAALLLFAASSPSAKVSAQVNGLLVSGRVCCTPTGNCLPGQLGLAGVSVLLNCTVLGRTATYGVAVTDATGTYSLLVTAAGLPGVVLGRLEIPCSIVVPLPARPAGICTVLSIATGFLVGTVRGVGTTVLAFLGLVQTATVNLYVRVG